MTRPAAPQALLDLVKCGCTSGCSTQRCRCAIAKDILTEMKFVSAQTARISHTSKHHSLHTMTKRLIVTHDLILHCVVLLQLKCWKESAHHSSILDHYMFYNIQPCIYPSDEGVRCSDSWMHEGETPECRKRHPCHRYTKTPSP